jgi:hypothetical protein
MCSDSSKKQRALVLKHDFVLFGSTNFKLVIPLQFHAEVGSWWERTLVRDPQAIYEYLHRSREPIAGKLDLRFFLISDFKYKFHSLHLRLGVEFMLQIVRRKYRESNPSEWQLLAKSR